MQNMTDEELKNYTDAMNERLARTKQFEAEDKAAQEAKAQDFVKDPNAPDSTKFNENLKRIEELKKNTGPALPLNVDEAPAENLTPFTYPENPTEQQLAEPLLNREPASVGMFKLGYDIYKKLTLPDSEVILGKPVDVPPVTPDVQNTQKVSAPPPKFTKAQTVSPSLNQLQPIPKNPLLEEAGKIAESIPENSPEAIQASVKTEKEAIAKATEENVAYAKAIRNRIPDYQQQLEENNKKVIDQVQSINQMAQVDPTRLFNDAGVFGKVGFLLSAAYGGMNTGGALDNVLKADLTSQIKNYEQNSANQNGILSVYLKHGEDLQTAIQSAMGFQKALSQAIQENAMAQSGATPQAIIMRANEIAAVQKKQKVDTLAEVAAKQVALSQTQQEINAKNIGFKQNFEQKKMEQAKMINELEKPTEKDLSQEQNWYTMDASHKNLTDLEKGLKGIDFTKYKDAALLQSYLSDQKGVTGEMIRKSLIDTFRDEKKVDNVMQYVNEVKQFSLGYLESLPKGRPSPDQAKALVARFAPPNVGTREGALLAMRRRQEAIAGLERSFTRAGMAHHTLQQGR